MYAIRSYYVEEGRGFFYYVIEADRLVLRRGQFFERVNGTIVRDHDAVRESASDVNANAISHA